MVTMNQTNIKTQELRIGNWVALSGTMLMRIYEIHEDCFYAKDEKNSSFKNTWADIQPIPLSDEVLLKAGAKYNHGVRDSYSLGDIELYNSTIDSGFFLGNVNGGELDWIHLPKVEIKYLHQLQNLFYSLTQSELETNFF